jgi:tetratricopeptide (TPR) repeat protein
MQVDAMSYNGKHADQAALFYHQSWAMVHDLVFNEQRAGIPTLAQFLGRPALERDPIADFERGFGVSAADMDRRLAKYLDHGRFQTFTWKFDRGAVENAFALKPAAAADVDLALGNLLVGVGRPGEAEAYLWRALTALPEDPRAPEAAAGMCLALNQIDRAFANYRQAQQRGSRSYLVHFMLAQQALRDATQLAFGEPDATEAVGHLLKTLEFNPRFGPAYESLALAATLLPQRSAEAEAMVARAAVRYPANAKLQAGAAALAAKYDAKVKVRTGGADLSLQRLRSAP